MFNLYKTLSKSLFCPQKLIKFPRHFSTSSPPPNLAKASPSFKIRQMTLAESDIVVKWANQEDWIICKGDGEAFYRADPAGFFVGEADGNIVCAYAAIKHESFVCLTLHLVPPEERGKGYGALIYEHAKRHYKDSEIIAFDVADKLIEKYKRQGYKLYFGSEFGRKKAEGTLSPDLVDLRDFDIEQVARYDADTFGYYRKEMIESMIKQKTNYSLGAVKDGKLCGFGILKERLDGSCYLISPLSADSKEIAAKLFSGLQSKIVGKEVYTAVFDNNPGAMEIWKEQGWEALSTYYRMYKGENLKTDLNKNYVPANY